MPIWDITQPLENEEHGSKCVDLVYGFMDGTIAPVARPPERDTNDNINTGRSLWRHLHLASVIEETKIPSCLNRRSTK